MSSGGQDNEIGSEYRARLGALLATSVLLASDVRHVGAPFWGTPLTIRAEADSAVDDLVVLFGDGRRAYIQAKHAVQLSKSVTSPFGKAIAQFVEAHRQEQSDEPLVLAYSRGSEPLSHFGRWCESLRFAEPGIPSRKQQAAAEQ